MKRALPRDGQGRSDNEGSPVLDLPWKQRAFLFQGLSWREIPESALRDFPG